MSTTQKRYTINRQEISTTYNRSKKVNVWRAKVGIIEWHDDKPVKFHVPHLSAELLPALRSLEKTTTKRDLISFMHFIHSTHKVVFSHPHEVKPKAPAVAKSHLVFKDDDGEILQVFTVLGAKSDVKAIEAATKEMRHIVQSYFELTTKQQVDKAMSRLTVDFVEMPRVIDLTK